MIDLGTIKPGSTIPIPFAAFSSDDPSASITITGLATTDIEVYKGTSMTQRSSDSGYTLIDTDGIDLDSTTGIHGISIDTSDNTDSGFWTVGDFYWVVIASITVDAATINFIPARFRLGYTGALFETTIATLASQTSFTLTAGSAEDDTYFDCPVIVHDIASDVQICIGYISDYTGSTRTVTLGEDPAIFTMAAGDNISIFPPAGVGGWRGERPAILFDDDFIRADIRRWHGVSPDVLTSGKVNTNVVNVNGTAQTAGDIPGLITGLNDINASEVNAEVVDALNTDTYAEPGQGAPAATTTLAAKINYLYKAWRNRATQTASQYSLYDDAGTTVDQKASVSDDGTTAEKSEVIAGP